MAHGGPGRLPVLRGPRAPRRGRGWTSCCGLATAGRGPQDRRLVSALGLVTFGRLLSTWCGCRQPLGLRGQDWGLRSPWKPPTSAKSPGKPVPGQQHLAPPRGVRQVGGGAPSPHPSEQAVPAPGTRVSRAERGRLPMPRRWRRPCSDPLSSGAGGPGSEAQQKAPTPPPSSKATLVSLSLVPGDQRGPLFHPTVCRGSAAAGPRAQDSVSRATACQTEVDGAQVSQAEALRVCDTVKVTAAPRTRQSGLEAGGRLLGGRVTEPGAGRLARTVKWASRTSFSKGSRILVKR